MSAIEENNRDRLLLLGSRRADEMTKRERIAMEAMAAIIASGSFSTDPAKDAVEMADALIRELNR